MGTDLKPVRVILAGTVGRTGKITELDLMIRVIRVNAGIKGDLEETVTLLPVRLGNEFKLLILRSQADPLGDDG